MYHSVRVVNDVSSAVKDKRFYREKKSFLCMDGSKLIPFEQVNDDYCDCADGSDEPGKTTKKVFRCLKCMFILYTCSHLNYYIYL